MKPGCSRGRRFSAGIRGSGARLTPPELEEMLARHHPSSAVLRLGEQLCWRIAAIDGLEEHFSRITNLLGILPGQGDPLLPRLILAGTGGQGTRNSTVPSRADQLGNEDGWQQIELPDLHVYIRKDPPDAVCELQGGSVEISGDGWLPSVLLPVYLKVIERGGMVLHAAAVERDGEAVLLAGKGGAGKSTCCRRIVPPWRAVCDDLCLALPGPGSGFLVHPLPTWSELTGKSGKGTWHIERGLPLRGFFFLEQGEEDEFLHLGKAEASVHLWKAGVGGTFHWRRGLDRATRQSVEQQLLETAMRAVKILPGFRLRVSGDGAFWKHMEKALAPWPASGPKNPSCREDR